jgi:hypothetical protein
MVVEIYNASNQVVASSLPTPGLAVASVPLPPAGSYRIKVKNLGLSASTITTSLLTRAVWPLIPLDLELP